MSKKRFNTITALVLLTIFVIALQVALKLIPHIIPFEYHYIIDRIALVISVLLISWILLGILSFLKKRLLRKYDIVKEDNLQSRRIHTQVNVLEKVFIIMIILLASGIILLSFDNLRNIGISFFASAGVAGIIIGFAA